MISTHVRLPPSLIERLDFLAAERKITRSRLVRQLLEVGVEGRPAAAAEPLGEEELLAILTERARNGHVSATKILLDIERQ